MKKFWKIAGISICSILGTALLAICICVYIVFTPKRLTPLVSNIADKYIKCEHQISTAELTFFSTFPNFGLHIDDLYLIHAMRNAPSDTLLAVPEAVAVINPIKLLREQTLDVRKILLKNASANVFVNENGESNTDVFILSEDTVPKNDTTTFSLPFDKLKIDELTASIDNFTYRSIPDSMDIRVKGLSLIANARSWDDIDLRLSGENVSATIGNESYADGLQCAVRLHNTACNIDSMTFKLRDASLNINEFAIHIAGDISLQNTIAMSLDIHTNDWQVPELLQLLPENIKNTIRKIDIQSGKVHIDAHAEGVYNDTTMPIVNAKLSLTDASGAYKDIFPYTIKDINIDADAHIDLNDPTISNITLNLLKARTQNTTIEAKGKIYEPMADMLCDLHTNVKLHLPDILPLLPKATQQQISAKGTLKGNMHTNIRLSDLTAMRLHKGEIKGNIRFDALDVTYDSIFVNTPEMSLTFHIPNIKSHHKTTNWLKATLQTNGIHCNLPSLQANIGKASGTIETSNILSNNPIIYASCAFNSEIVDATTDSMSGTLQQPALSLYTEYDIQDTTHIPFLNAALGFEQLNGRYDKNYIQTAKSDISATLSGGKRNKTQPRLQLQLTTDALNASMDDEIHVQTQRININATARRNPNYKDILLQWNPRLDVELTDGVVNMASFKETIQIPTIDFDYSNKKCNITDSKIIIGKSDFALTGQIDNIGKWLKNETILKGELNFVSNHTDINELMFLTSSDTGSEETDKTTNKTPPDTHTEEESQPYLVPTTVDLNLNTLIKEATIFDQTATNIGGKLYIKDGILVLEEMGFICNAARLQLTAMYKTPRRNHLYLGLDYHMLDINIEELVNMIPQIDSMVPMLRSFHGSAEFHLAAETYMNSNYDLKTSTTRGACSISGKDLVLLDNETFGQIAKILMFNKKTENKVDSISAEITLFKNEIDIYPFCMSIDNYMAAVGGRHNLDMTFDYHISLLKPFYIGADISGSFDDLKIRLAKCRYAQDFRPIFRKETDTLNGELRKKIKESLQKNVKQ